VTSLVQTMAIHALYHDGHLACCLVYSLSLRPRGVPCLADVQPVDRRKVYTQRYCNTYRTKRTSGFGWLLVQRGLLSSAYGTQ
jgi:hypothetical protein